MDPKLEKKKVKELKKMNKKTLKQRAQDLMAEHEDVLNRHKKVQAAYNTFTAALIRAIDAKDDTTMEVIKSKMTVMEKELKRLVEREKTLAEELELVSKAYKNDFEGKSSAWTTAGAWIVGLATTGLSAWGLFKSHKSFEDGSMVDKSTKGIAERLNGLLSFLNFRK